MNRNRETAAALITALTAAAVWLMQIAHPASAYGAVEAPAAPEFTHHAPAEWINSPPLSLADLRGKVVLVDFWTFDCWNCYRSFPWLNSVDKRFGKRGLEVVGVHTPEFDHERVRENVVRKVAEFDLDHPVMIDNDYSYWNAMGNRYWPAYYLIDKHGRVRARFVGETHAGDAQAQQIESAVEKLLEEPL